MSDREQSAKQIRDALGRYNDQSKPVVQLVKDLRRSHDHAIVEIEALKAENSEIIARARYREAFAQEQSAMIDEAKAELAESIQKLKGLRA